MSDNNDFIKIEDIHETLVTLFYVVNKLTYLLGNLRDYGKYFDSGPVVTFDKAISSVVNSGFTDLYKYRLKCKEKGDVDE